MSQVNFFKIQTGNKRIYLSSGIILFLFAFLYYFSDRDNLLFAIISFIISLFCFGYALTYKLGIDMETEEFVFSVYGITLIRFKIADVRRYFVAYYQGFGNFFDVNPKKQIKFDDPVQVISSTCDTSKNSHFIACRDDKMRFNFEIVKNGKKKIIDQIFLIDDRTAKKLIDKMRFINPDMKYVHKELHSWFIDKELPKYFSISFLLVLLAMTLWLLVYVFFNHY